MTDAPSPQDDRRGQRGASADHRDCSPGPSTPDAPTQAAVPGPDQRYRRAAEDTRDWYPAGSPPGGPPYAPQPPLVAPWDAAPQHNPRRSRRVRQSVVAAGAVVVIAASGLAVYAATGDRTTIAGTATTVSATAAAPTSTPRRTPRPTPAPPPPAPMVATEDLERLLIDDAALSELVGVSLAPDFAPVNTTMSIEATDNPQCRGALTVAAEPAYGESRWMAIRRQTSRNRDTKRSLVQAVVSYPSAQAATAYVEAQARTWRICDGQIISFDPDTNPLPIRIHSVRFDDTGLSAVATSETQGSNCFRELRSVANVVIDTAACNPATVAAAEGADDAERVAAMIAERIPG